MTNNEKHLQADFKNTMETIHMEAVQNLVYDAEDSPLNAWHITSIEQLFAIVLNHTRQEDQQEVSQALRSIRTHYTAMLDLMATEVFKGTLKAYQRTPETLDLLMEHLKETLILDHMKRPVVPSFGDDEDF